MTQPSGIALLETVNVPVVDGQIDWNALSAEELHHVIQGAIQQLEALEPSEPTDGVLERSVELEETARALAPLQHHYAGLVEDAFHNPALRSTIGLGKGKTPFRDTKDLLAKTHGLRAFEATGRLKLARTLTPARSTDPDRDDNVAVGETKYPLLGALQARGKLHPSKLATAVNMLDDIDDHADTAGKDQTFRNRLRDVVEQDLIDKIEHTTPEEFSRYVSRRKSDLVAAMDPPDKQFTTAQTQAMHTLRCDGPVRGNPNAHKWTFITDAEGNEALHAIAALANNPRTKTTDRDSEDLQPSDASEVPQQGPADRRSRGQRAMHALRDALKFTLGRLEDTDLPGTGGNHTQLVVLADYPTLLQHLRNELADLLPEIKSAQRERLLQLLVQLQVTEEDHPQDDGKVIDLPAEHVKNSSAQPSKAPPDAVAQGPPGSVTRMRPPKTTDVAEVLNAEDLNRLQSRVAQGIYTQYYPPEILLRLLCDVSVSPVTLTGDRQVLSVGRKQRQFPEAIRRAILARDRGCAVPGCHWPAAWCELHHITYWSRGGETSTDNGVLLCAHHHQSLHANNLRIEFSDGQWQFVQHPWIDSTQQSRSNYFWQN